MSLTREFRLRRRHLRVRRKVRGSADRPRLCLHKSLRHLYAQLIDDAAGRTLVFATTHTKASRSEARHCCNVAWAQRLGAEVARRAAERGISLVVFDRGGYRYHGVVKAFAEAAREGGLRF